MPAMPWAPSRSRDPTGCQGALPLPHPSPVPIHRLSPLDLSTVRTKLGGVRGGHTAPSPPKTSPPQSRLLQQIQAPGLGDKQKTLKGCQKGLWLGQQSQAPCAQRGAGLGEGKGEPWVVGPG